MSVIHRHPRSVVAASARPRVRDARIASHRRPMSLPLVIVVAVLLVQCILFGLLLEVRRRRARVEDTLRIAEARNAALLRMVPDLMFVISRDGVYLDYHAKDPRDLFVPPEHFLGKRIGDVFPPELAEAFEDVFQKALASDEPVSIEYSFQLHDGERELVTQLVRCDHARKEAEVRHEH